MYVPQIQTPPVYINLVSTSTPNISDGLAAVLAEDNGDFVEGVGGTILTPTLHPSLKLPVWAMALIFLASIAITLSLLVAIMHCLKRNDSKENSSDMESKASNGVNSGHRRSIEFVLPQPQTPLIYTSEPQCELPPVFGELDEEETTQHEPPPTPLPKPRDRHSTTSASSTSTCSSPTRRKSGSSRSRGSVQLEELDLSMYGDARDDELRGVTTIFSHGRILFSVAHDQDNECVIINILRAYGLTPTVASGGSYRPLMSKQRRQGRTDTNIRVHLIADSNQGYVTKVVRDTCNPVYEESFCFHLSQYEANSDVVVRLWVQEHDRFSRRNDIGTVSFHLGDLEDQVSSGDVMELWRDVISEKQTLKPRGQVLISMQYDYREKLLRVGVLSAKDLQLPPCKEPTEEQGVVYVKLTLISSDKVLSRRKSLSRRFSYSPSFQDGFSFPVDFHMLDNVTLVFTVYARDLTGKSTMIGRANVGSLTYTNGNGLKHWNEMLTAPSDVTELWHDLL